MEESDVGNQSDEQHHRLANMVQLSLHRSNFSNHVASGHIANLLVRSKGKPIGNPRDPNRFVQLTIRDVGERDVGLP